MVLLVRGWAHGQPQHTCWRCGCLASQVIGCLLHSTCVLNVNRQLKVFPRAARWHWRSLFSAVKLGKELHSYNKPCQCRLGTWVCCSLAQHHHDHAGCSLLSAWHKSNFDLRVRLTLAKLVGVVSE